MSVSYKEPFPSSCKDGIGEFLSYSFAFQRILITSWADFQLKQMIMAKDSQDYLEVSCWLVSIAGLFVDLT